MKVGENLIRDLYTASRSEVIFKSFYKDERRELARLLVAALATAPGHGRGRNKRIRSRELSRLRSVGRLECQASFVISNLPRLIARPKSGSQKSFFSRKF